LPSAQVARDIPDVVLLPQLPLPCGMGSWYCTVPVVVPPVQVRVTVSGTWMPAETVPLVGAPATFDWQLPRVPVKLYAKFPEALVRGGLMFATPCSWHAPPLGPAALARDPPRQAIALRAATKRIR